MKMSKQDFHNVVVSETEELLICSEIGVCLQKYVLILIHNFQVSPPQY